MIGVRKVHKHLFLAGFSGSGKSTVGKLAARRLGWTFVDLDKQVEAVCGESVVSILDRLGEPCFRRMETTQLRRICRASGRPLVVALGGGALVKKTNRSLVSRHGTSIYLRCSQTELLRRLLSGPPRPLLKTTVGSKSAIRLAISQLLASRRRHYEQCDIMISVTNLSPQETAKRVCEAIS